MLRIRNLSFYKIGFIVETIILLAIAFVWLGPHRAHYYLPSPEIDVVHNSNPSQLHSPNNVIDDTPYGSIVLAILTDTSSPYRDFKFQFLADGLFWPERQSTYPKEPGNVEYVMVDSLSVNEEGASIPCWNGWVVEVSHSGQKEIAQNDGSKVRLRTTRQDEFPLRLTYGDYVAMQDLSMCASFQDVPLTARGKFRVKLVGKEALESYEIKRQWVPANKIRFRHFPTYEGRGHFYFGEWPQL